MMRTEIAEGRLETALDDWRAEPRKMFAIYPSREHLPERVRTSSCAGRWRRMPCSWCRSTRPCCSG
ncbi:hypothetical protein [Cupriavidus sp. CP313]